MTVRREMWCALIGAKNEEMFLTDTMGVNYGLAKHNAGDWIREMWVQKDSVEEFQATIFPIRIVKVSVTEIPGEERE